MYLFTQPNHLVFFMDLPVAAASFGTVCHSTQLYQRIKSVQTSPQDFYLSVHHFLRLHSVIL